VRSGRFPYVLTVLTALSVIGLCALGAWQLRRLSWKEGLIARAEAAATRPPAPLAQVLAEGGDAEFRRVLVVCRGLNSAPFIELQSIQDGGAGVRLISACTTEGRTWLVDRGFVPDAVSARPPVGPSSLPVVILGQLRRTPATSALTPPPSGARFYGRDAPAMARALNVAGPVSPETVFALTSANPEWRALQPSAPPVALSNNHLGYALTWFGLAAALVGIYLALLRRRRSPELNS
jgi:surfeit locus 1 family protein